MPDIYRTISGALFRAPNLEHNNRDHIPWNAVQNRADRNVIFVNGTKDFTLEQVYDKLFQKSMRSGLQRSGKRAAPRMIHQPIMKRLKRIKRSTYPMKSSGR